MLKPLNGNLIVKVEKMKEVTSASGIIVSSGDEVLVERATVIATPPESNLYESQTVYYKGYSLSTIKIGDEEFNFLPESEVLGYE